MGISVINSQIICVFDTSQNPLTSYTTCDAHIELIVIFFWGVCPLFKVFDMFSHTLKKRVNPVVFYSTISMVTLIQKYIDAPCKLL